MMATKSTKPLLIFAIALAIGGFVASSMGIHVMAATQETQGKLPVKLTEKFSLSFPDYTTAVAWSPDGSTLGVASNFGVRLNTYDSSGQPLSEFERNGNKAGAEFSFAFVNGAAQVLFPVDGNAKDDAALDIRDTATGHIVQTITRDPTRILAKYFAVSSDQKRFAIANGYAGEAIIYSTDDGTNWHELIATKETTEGKGWFSDVSLSFFPDNRLVAVGQSDGHFAVVDSTSGETLKTFRAYVAPGIHDIVEGLAVSPKGELILTGLRPVAVSPRDVTPEANAWNRSDHAVVSIWRVSDGKEVASFRDKGQQVWQAVWDPKGRFVAFVESDSLVVWQPEAPDMRFIKIKFPRTLSLAITRDGKSLAVAGKEKVTVYNIEDN